MEVELSCELVGSTATKSKFVELFVIVIEPTPFVLPPPLASAKLGTATTNSANRQNLYMEIFLESEIKAVVNGWVFVTLGKVARPTSSDLV